jgi:hypothetical protein
MSKKLTQFETNSWDEILKSLKEARSILDLKDDEELWYRGVSSRDHSLLPSLHRCLKKNQREAQEIRYLETDLFFEFLAKARTLGGTSLDHWDVLFLMQHYRAPTRLLDWTETFHVALYFAAGHLSPRESKTPRVYIMNPYVWNSRHGRDRELVWPRYFTYSRKHDYFYEYGEILIEDRLSWKYPVALYPPHRDARLSAQRGFFTIHGYDSRPLDHIAPQLIVAIDLGKNAVEEAKEALHYSGTDEFSMFPDLEGLARHLKTKFEI